MGTRTILRLIYGGPELRACRYIELFKLDYG